MLGLTLSHFCSRTTIQVRPCLPLVFLAEKSKGIYRNKMHRSAAVFFLLLIFATDKGQVTLFQLGLEVLVDGKCDGLAGCNAHDARRDALVESVETFLPGGNCQLSCPISILGMKGRRLT